MTEFDLFKLRMGTSGSNIRDEQVVDSRKFIEETFADDPTYKEGIEIVNKGLINLRMSDYKLVYGNTPQMTIQALLTELMEFRLGDIFKYDNGYWLCVDARQFHDMYRFGKIEECNYLLRWQNQETYEIIERWCSVRNPYSSGLEEGRIVTTGDAKYQIKLPHDVQTELFYSGRRFLISVANHQPKAYKVIEYDSVTNRYEFRNEGFLEIVLQECEVTDKDNTELMIADYIDPLMPPTPIGSCKITCLGDAILKVGSSARPYTAVFYDADGNEIGLIPTWEVILPPEIDAGQITQVESGQVISLRASSETKIGSKLALKMTANDVTYGNFEYELEITIMPMF